MPNLKGLKTAILATDGYEQSELFEPKRQVESAGGITEVISIKDGSITGWDDKNWGESVDVNVLISDAAVDDYAGLILPGGQINPDVLRKDGRVIEFIRHFVASGKPVAAICHAPWLLIEADVVRDKKVTSYGSITTDLRNAGAEWLDQEVVVDGNLITSRSPEDLDAFCAAFIEQVAQVEKAGAIPTN